MATAIEELAEAELQVVGIDFLAPCCEMCGQTLGPDVQVWWVEWEGALEGDWPRFHPDCYDDWIGEHGRDEWPDIFEYTTVKF